MRPDETTALLSAARHGDRRAVDVLFAHVYTELQRLAHRRIEEASGPVTLSPTGLVHEAYLKLIEGGDWSDRAHFFALAARAMRQILIDRARARTAQKRGGGAAPVTLQDTLIGEDAFPLDRLLALDAALDRLALRDAEMARLVELRFFGGMEMDDVAEVLEVSPRTATRIWTRARAYLRADLHADFA